MKVTQTKRFEKKIFNMWRAVFIAARVVLHSLNLKIFTENDNCNLLKEHLLISLTGSLYCIDWNGCESVFVCKPVFGILIFIKSSDQTCSLRPRKTDSLRKVNLLSRNVTRYTAWEYFWINLCKKKQYNCCIVGWAETATPYGHLKETTSWFLHLEKFSENTLISTVISSILNLS